jgi:hypothetical protein
MIDTQRAQRYLASIWFVIGGFAFLWLLSYTWLGRFGGPDKPEGVKHAWLWFSTTVLPTLSLMIGVLAHQALAGTEQRPRSVPRLLFRICVGVSVVYLITVSGVIIRARDYLDPAAFLGESVLYLVPLQGLLGATLGVFFASPGK